MRSRKPIFHPSVTDPLTGLVCFVGEAEMERSDPSLFIVSARTADTIRYGLPSNVSSGGSGAALTYHAAYGAAVGECLERYALSLIHPEDLLFGSYSDLLERGRNPIKPSSWALFDPDQYETIRYKPFTKDAKIAWLQADDLVTRGERLVPACLVHVPYHSHFSTHGEVELGPAISTGTACARSRSEALLKSICELVERDAFMIVWRNRLACPRVQIDAASGLFSIYHERFTRPGLEYRLYYTTLDLEVPSFWGLLIDHTKNPPSVVAGGAAHPNPDIAALKTLCELVQGLKWRDYEGFKFEPIDPTFRNIRAFDDRAVLYATHGLLEAFDFLSDVDQVSLSSLPNHELGDASANWRQCVDWLSNRGLDVVAVDITPIEAYECGLHVVRVMIPQCETMEGDHLLPFLGGNRWREVPVLLGRQAQPTRRDSINSYPHPYP